MFTVLVRTQDNIFLKDENIYVYFRISYMLLFPACKVTHEHIIHRADTVATAPEIRMTEAVYTFKPLLHSHQGY